VNAIEANLLALMLNHAQIADCLESKERTSEFLISLSLDAMAVTSDRRFLFAMESDFIFLFYAQP
jgi:hypothetical protein